MTTTVDATPDLAAPDVTIVLITYNDAERLPRALASCQEQTLANIEILVVDDCSTDATAEVVTAAAAADPRVRYVRLPVNSGGCSRPRNTGVASARGRWVMFCDSDDRLERHAAKNLLLAAERADAQMACGVVERVDVTSGKVKRWRADLHDPAVLNGIGTRPELIADTVSVNKIYDRAWVLANGIAFPEGILYEDQLFTFAAFALAERMAVIDETVYYWSVERLADEPSITQRRDELRNVRSRIAVNELIDAFIAERGLEWLRPVKDRKFLAHDLYLYLSTMLDADDETALALLDELRPYVSGIDAAATVDLRPALRVAVAHLLLRDLDHLRAAMRAVKWAASIDAPVETVDVDGIARDIWACGHEHGPDLRGLPMRAWLDVTAYRVGVAPRTRLRPCHRLTTFATAQGPAPRASRPKAHVLERPQPNARLQEEARPDVGSEEGDHSGSAGASAHGRAPSALWPEAQVPHEARPREPALEARGGAHLLAVAGSSPVLRADAVPVSAELVFTGPGERVLFALPLEIVVDGARWEWRAAGPLVPVASDAATAATSGRLAIAMRFADGSVNVTPVRADTGLDVRGRIVVGGQAIDVEPGEHAEVGWRTRKQPPPPLLTRLVRRFVNVLARLLPGSGAGVVLCAAGGRRRSGTVEALSVRLAARYPNVRQGWLVAAQSDAAPNGVDILTVGSIAMWWRIGRARVVVEDAGLPVTARMRRHVVHLHVGQDVPVMRIGKDAPDFDLDSARTRTATLAPPAWTHLLLASDYDASARADALGFSGTRLVMGSVRGACATAVGREQARTMLGLRPDQHVVLWAPEIAGLDEDATQERFERLLTALVAAFGDRAFVLVRSQSLRLRLPSVLRTSAREVSNVPDATLFVAAADVVLTDVSPLLLDAVRAGRPVVVDAERLPVFASRTRGLALDVLASPPGDLAFDTDAVVAAVAAALDGPAAYQERHADGIASAAAAAGPDADVDTVVDLIARYA